VDDGFLGNGNGGPRQRDVLLHVTLRSCGALRTNETNYEPSAMFSGLPIFFMAQRLEQHISLSINRGMQMACFMSILLLSLLMPYENLRSLRECETPRITYGILASAHLQAVAALHKMFYRRFLQI
jgi:hypothetical protein